MISLGFSPCPNDTFIFYALAHKKVDTRGIDFDFIIEDVETLNRLSVKKQIDITKVSCHAYCRLHEDYRFLHSGGAFGRGCGPLLVAKTPLGPEELGGKRIAIPGRLTTAFLLFNLFSSAFNLQPSTFLEMPFDRIMKEVGNGGADAGLIIHESRFTYRDHGLAQIADLGEWWEKETGLPIPLGGIIANRSLGDPVIRDVEEIIRESVTYALSHSGEAMPYIRKYSQELSESVIMRHIALYVNNYTVDIGDDGELALDELLKKAAASYKNVGAIPVGRSKTGQGLPCPYKKH